MPPCLHEIYRKERKRYAAYMPEHGEIRQGAREDRKYRSQIRGLFIEPVLRQAIERKYEKHYVREHKESIYRSRWRKDEICQSDWPEVIRCIQPECSF